MTTYQTSLFNDSEWVIIRFCAIECGLQRSGENSVEWMLRAWDYACLHRHRVPVESDVLALGALVEPTRNANGYRTCGVRVGSDVKGRWEEVPREMIDLMAKAGRITVHPPDPAEWFRAYEEVHPFIDGNGRTGAILFNWLAGTLDNPDWPPNFWLDPRRLPGAGAPKALDPS